MGAELTTYSLTADSRPLKQSFTAGQHSPAMGWGAAVGEGSGEEVLSIETMSKPTQSIMGVPTEFSSVEGGGGGRSGPRDKGQRSAEDPACDQNSRGAS